ncbi:Xaa-Pro dipeptidyl-peptidase [Microbacterium terrisoli]|uniref:Xaa-Pro dipeptidyl-peptidase n=1 Tax=Microbacterium terrisoli TaxID=3242192 RepID=UPI002804EFB2|nr:Xaa-Pro dipeptidyl-peptidase [Microbacterium protaetiae]
MTDLEKQRALRRRRGLTAVLTSSVVVCGMLVTTPAMASPAPAPTEPTFQDGLSQAVFTTDRAQWVRQEAWVESDVDSDRDGKNDLVHVDVTRVPETDAGLKVPVIMEMSPYYAGGSSVGNWSVDHEIGEPPTTKPGFPAPRPPATSPKISSSWESAWVPRGYAVVHAESLGSGFSEGCPTSGGPNESAGGRAVVDWLNGRVKAYASPDRTTEVSASSWATGSVGMIGTSYNGTLPIGVASTGVKGLDAIVPVSAISDWYNYYRANGAVRAPGGYQGEDLDVLADYVHTRLPQSQCQPVIDELRAKQDRATGDRTAFWAERDYLAHPENITAATLVAHGLNDWNVMTKNASDLYEALKKTGTPHQIYLHQGGHGGNPSDTMLNRWFTRYLYKQHNGVENLPKAYVVREDRVLTEYPDWPDTDARPATVWLGAASEANTVGALRFTKQAQAPKETIVDDASKRVSTLAAASQSSNRLVYRTPVLNDDIRLSGTPTVSVNLSVDRPKANLSAVLLQYSDTGAAKVISRGWMDVENRNSDAVTDTITPGRFYQFSFAFEPKDYVFAEGTSIGVMVISSDNEYTVRPAAGTTLTVDPSKSKVSLPIVGGVAKLVQSIDFHGAGLGVPGPRD